MDRIDVYQRMISTGVIPLFYSPDIEASKKLVIACFEGGARVVEFTNRGEQALEVFVELRRFIREKKIDIALGVGSIVDPHTAAVFRAYGADFFVGPILDEDLAKWCNKQKLAYLPGCMTVKEISQAEELGAEIVKVFPGEIAGIKLIKSVLGPMPWSKLMPTGGVSPERENITSWFAAGAVCVGLGSQLFTKELIQEQNYKKISDSVNQVIGWIQFIHNNL
jgi:2-dehydro-3-deoxyphosphogluconate aldolase/(4S)-4-hydroxy-2-oxoglutarate aldolase